MLPDFIGVGPARTATTWSYDCLKSHPEICMAKWDKKTHFFDFYFKKGISWYEDFYAQCPNGKIRGELTETYFYYDEIPQRIFSICPHVKIFICLRNPIERAFSAYHHLVRDGVLTCSFEEALKTHKKIFITDSMYVDRLKPYFDVFPVEQLHITFFDDIKKDQKTYLKNLYSFLGVDPDYLPPDYDKVKNKTEQPRFPLMNKCMLLTHHFLRERHLYRYVLPLKDSRIVKALRFKEGKSPLTLEEKTEEMLQKTFLPQIEALSDLTDRDLSSWIR